MARHGGDLRLLRCPVCGWEGLKPAHVKACSRECGRVLRRQAVRTVTCIACASPFEYRGYGTSAGLCPTCKRLSGGQRLVWLTCPVCGLMVRRQSRYKTCSRQCGNLLQWAPRRTWSSDRERVLAKGARRRLRMRGADGVIERLDPDTIAIRDGWICGICREVVSPDVRYPDPLSASIDHIVPLSRGGQHTAANVRLAHFGCNRDRGNRSADRLPVPA